MSGYELINEIGDLTKLLNSSVAAYSRRGRPSRITSCKSA